MYVLKIHFAILTLKTNYTFVIWNSDIVKSKHDDDGDDDDSDDNYDVDSDNTYDDVGIALVPAIVVVVIDFVIVDGNSDYDDDGGDDEDVIAAAAAVEKYKTHIVFLGRTGL